MLVAFPGARKLLGSQKGRLPLANSLQRDRDAAADEACCDISTSLIQTAYQGSSSLPSGSLIPAG